MFLSVSQPPKPRTPACGLGRGLPAPGRTPKLRGPQCPARPAPYLAGAVLRRRRRGGWAAQSHIVPGRGGRSQLRVTSAANNEGFDRRGARPARSPAPRPPPPPARPARPLPAPSPDPITARRARPSRPSAAAARPAPRAAVRSERRPLPGGLRRPSPGGSSSLEEWGARGGGSGLKRGSSRDPPCSCALRPVPSPSALRRTLLPAWAARPAPGPNPRHPHLGLGPAANPRAAPLRLGSLGARVSTLRGARFLALLASTPSIPARVSRPRSPAPHSFREARPSSVQDRLPNQLEEGPENGVTLCTRPVVSPKLPSEYLLGLGSQGTRPG